MCGRYALHCNLPELMARLGAGGFPPLPPRYNIAPTQDAPIVLQDAARQTRGMSARWGLVPHWSKGPESRYAMINARAETLATRPAYRQAFGKRRCLVPASGFYEWRRTAAGKQPHYITRSDGDPLILAGLWETWSAPDASPLTSFTIITTTANATMAPIHERMPVILGPEAWTEWLAAETPPGHLLAPCAPELITARPVSRRVNSPAHDAPDCIAPLAVAAADRPHPPDQE